MSKEAKELFNEMLEKAFPKPGTRKIADLPKACNHAEHNPPTHMVYEPGIWEHICPNCRKRQVFTITKATLEKPYREDWCPDWKGDPDDPNRWKGW